MSETAAGAAEAVFVKMVVTLACVLLLRGARARFSFKKGPEVWQCNGLSS